MLDTAIWLSGIAIAPLPPANTLTCVSDKNPQSIPEIREESAVELIALRPADSSGTGQSEPESGITDRHRYSTLR